MYSEEYQVKCIVLREWWDNALTLLLQAAVLSATFPVFDKYRKTYFVGELVWNFADFETAQGKVKPSREHPVIYHPPRWWPSWWKQEGFTDPWAPTQTWCLGDTDSLPQVGQWRKHSTSVLLWPVPPPVWSRISQRLFLQLHDYPQLQYIICSFTRRILGGKRMVCFSIHGYEKTNHELYLNAP